jgi:hypothetical protein
LKLRHYPKSTHSSAPTQRTSPPNQVSIPRASRYTSRSAACSAIASADAAGARGVGSTLGGSTHCDLRSRRPSLATNLCRLRHDDSPAGISGARANELSRRSGAGGTGARGRRQGRGRIPSRRTIREAAPTHGCVGRVRNQAGCRRAGWCRYTPGTRRSRPPVRANNSYTRWQGE